MRYGVLWTFLATILSCTDPLWIEAEHSSLPRPQEELTGARLELSRIGGKRPSLAVMNCAFSLNEHYALRKLTQNGSLGREDVSRVDVGGFIPKTTLITVSHSPSS